MVETVINTKNPITISHKDIVMTAYMRKIMLSLGFVVSDITEKVTWFGLKKRYCFKFYQ